tara:strand:- start:113 stop:322 length:210 start_codon:yes stop_codon:yes gene_type:complete
MFQTYRKANRKAWFGIDKQIKASKIKPQDTSNKKKSLLTRPDESDRYGDITPTAEYVLAIREAVNKVKA